MCMLSEIKTIQRQRMALSMCMFHVHAHCGSLNKTVITNTFEGYHVCQELIRRIVFTGVVVKVAKHLSCVGECVWQAVLSLASTHLCNQF